MIHLVSYGFSHVPRQAERTLFMTFKKTCTAIIACIVVCVASEGFAQRAIGAHKLVLDNNAGKSVTLQPSTAPMSSPYILKLPAPGPPFPKSFLVSDENGIMRWLDESEIAPSGLPGLPQGNIWVGNGSGIATAFAPGPVGSFMVIDAGGMPSWTSALPPTTTIAASQITSGTLPPGTTITVGGGSSIVPGAGTIIANGLSGAGPGKFSGKTAIPTGSDFLDVSYPGIQAGSAVNLMVNDANAGIWGYVSVQVQSITPGVGFRAIFAAAYPPSGTGQLHWTVVNP